jgi:methyl-accepting chemotaxis protein
MFNSKKEKILEEELEWLREENKSQQVLLAEMTEQRGGMTENLEYIGTSRTQMEQDLEQVSEHIEHIRELSGSSEAAAGEVHKAIIELNNAVGTFDANHSVFIKKRKEQDEKIMEIVESNKHFTTPMKHISEYPAAQKESYVSMQQHVAQMHEFSRNMSVLSLNAAIEAGRLGGAGTSFITAAEEVRAYSEQYEREASALGEKIEQAEQRLEVLEEQVHYLNELLKENNISMSKVLQNGMQSMASYENSQLDLRGILSETAVGQSDALQQSAKEAGRIEERMSIQMSDIRDEFGVQGEYVAKLSDFMQKRDNADAGKKENESEK